MEKVMILGDGGREHALAWKLSQSDHVGKIYCVPGSGGINQTEKCESVRIEDYNKMADFAKENKISLVIAGPEKPLVEGAADLFLKRGIRIFGPVTEAARLEGSKVYAKKLMAEYGIPTAPFDVFADPKSALEYVEKSGPVYVKADGLTAGKGAIDGRTVEKAKSAVYRLMLSDEFGNAGKEIVIEEFLPGAEASYMMLVNSAAGVEVPLIPSKDHKKIGNNETGENTGGIGAVAPASDISGDLEKKVRKEIIERTLNGLNDMKLNYTGVLYPGLKIVEEHGVLTPYVLEYNVRFGDPEIQAVLPLLKTDFYELLYDVAEGRKPAVEWHGGHCVCIVAVCKGYPGAFKAHDEIFGLKEASKDSLVFHAGTLRDGGRFYTARGRALNVVATGETLAGAREKAYKSARKIYFEGMYYRKDIGLGNSS